MDIIRRLSLGGLSLRLNYRGFHSLPPFDAPYRSFLDIESASDDIDIDIHRTNSTGFGNGTPLFEMTGAWSAWREEQGFFFRFTVPDTMRATWEAMCMPDADRATLYWSAGVSHEEDALINPFAYPADQLLMIFFLAHHRGIIMHAAGGAFEHNGVLFAGVSGAGKSTVSMRLAASEDWNSFSDDRIIVRDPGDGFRLFGTPWPGDSRIACRGDASLRALIFLKKDTRNALTLLTSHQSIQRLLPVVSVPWFEPSVMERSLAVCDELLARIPVFELAFKLDCPIHAIVRDVLS